MRSASLRSALGRAYGGGQRDPSRSALGGQVHGAGFAWVGGKSQQGDSHWCRMGFRAVERKGEAGRGAGPVQGLWCVWGKGNADALEASNPSSADLEPKFLISRRYSIAEAHQIGDRIDAMGALEAVVGANRRFSSSRGIWLSAEGSGSRPRLLNHGGLARAEQGDQF